MTIKVLFDWIPEWHPSCRTAVQFHPLHVRLPLLREGLSTCLSDGSLVKITQTDTIHVISSDPEHTFFSYQLPLVITVKMTDKPRQNILSTGRVVSCAVGVPHLPNFHHRTKPILPHEHVTPNEDGYNFNKCFQTCAFLSITINYNHGPTSFARLF